MKSLRLALLALTLAALVGVLAACGSSGAGGDTDPAGFAPAGAPLYLEAVVRPEGQQRANLEAVARRVSGSDDPVARLVALLDRSARQDGVSFSRDVEPWLGKRIGLAVTSLRGQGNADAVVVVASRDDGKASAALDKLLAKDRASIVKRSYRGVDYRYDGKDRSAAAVVDHALVVGSTEAGFKAAVDASKGDSLAEGDGLKGARDKVASDRLGLLYVDVAGFLRAVSERSGSNPQTGALLQAVGGTLPRTLAAAVTADPDAVRVDAVSLGTPRAATGTRSGADALAGLPSQAWLGLGVGDLGKVVEGLLTQLTSSGGLTGVGVQALQRQLEQQTGLDLRRDVLSWMGDAGLFVAGASGSDVHGGLVVHTTDPAATRRTLEKLVALVPRGGGRRVTPLHAQGVDAGYSLRSAGSPTIYVALAGERFVVAYGREALSEAIQPGATLGSSAEFKTAAGKLGGGVRPSFFLSLHQVTELLAVVSSGDPSFAQAQRYLDAFGAVVAGSKDEGGGVKRARGVVTLR